MVSLNLNLSSYPIASGYQWFGKHVHDLTSQLSWRRVAGGLLLFTVASCVIRLIYQKLAPAPIVARAFLDMKIESAEIIGSDDEFKFKDHLKTVAGIPIVPDKYDFYVFLQINGETSRKLLDIICGIGKEFNFKFNYARYPDRAGVTGWLISKTVQEFPYYEGVILPSTLFQGVKDQVSFRWDNHLITLNLKVGKPRTSHAKLFPELVPIVFEEKRQPEFQECFRMLEGMFRFDNHDIPTRINLGEKFDFSLLTTQAQFYSPDEGLTELTPRKKETVKKILKTASPFMESTIDQTLHIHVGDAQISAIIDRRHVIIAGHEELPEVDPKKELIGGTFNLNHYLVIKTEHDIDPTTFKIKPLGNSQARIRFSTFPT